MTRASLAVLALLLGASAAAADTTARDRFELWNGCRAMDLVVETPPAGAAAIGLTRRAIVLAVRARLHAARIYDPEAEAFLHVDAVAVGRAFHFSIGYRKWLTDPRTGEKGATATWVASSTGTHGGEAGYVLSAIAAHAERFVAEYLRVNADSCPR